MSEGQGERKSNIAQPLVVIGRNAQGKIGLESPLHALEVAALLAQMHQRVINQITFEENRVVELVPPGALRRVN